MSETCARFVSNHFDFHTNRSRYLEIINSCLLKSGALVTTVVPEEPRRDHPVYVEERKPALFAAHHHDASDATYN
jgi:hypothetical protein